MPEFRNAMYCSSREEVFIQPILTEDGTVGGDKFAVRASSYYSGDYYAHHSFQYFEGTYCAISKNSTPTVSDPYYYTMYFPKGAKLYSITHRNRNSNQYGAAKDLELQGSNDDSHWTTLTTYQNTNDTANAMWKVSIPSAKQGWYRYYRYKITSTNSRTFAAIGFLTINGVWRNPETIEIPLYTRTSDSEISGKTDAPIVHSRRNVHAACSNKNDAFASSINCKVPKKAYSTKYYKETAWTQPILTANGTLGGSSFAVSASTQYNTSSMPWMAFDGTDTKYWRANTGSGYLIFYNPNPLKVTKISYKNWTVYPILVAVYGSYNNNVWIPIKIVRNTNYTSKASWDIDLSSNTEFYKYYKVEVRGMTSSQVYCTELAITATQLTTGTASDYTKAVVEYDRLLLRQLTAGSYRFTSTGNVTFTVPKGVKVIYVQAGSYNQDSSQSQSVVNTETGNTWCSAVMWDNGDSETVDWETSTVNNYIKVNSGETYSLTVSSSSMASLPLISWSYDINNQTPVYDERKIKE